MALPSSCGFVFAPPPIPTSEVFVVSVCPHAIGRRNPTCDSKRPKESASSSSVLPRTFQRSSASRRGRSQLVSRTNVWLGLAESYTAFRRWWWEQPWRGAGPDKLHSPQKHSQRQESSKSFTGKTEVGLMVALVELSEPKWSIFFFDGLEVPQGWAIRL